MSDRAMEMAMELFRASPNFRKAVRNADDKGGYVNTILPSHTPPTKEAELAGAEEEGLTDEEQAKINDLPWNNPAVSDADLINRIGTTGCTYT